MKQTILDINDMQNRFVLIPEQRANSSESTIIRIAP